MLTLGNLESRLQDMTAGAMKGRALTRFPTLVGQTTGLDPSIVFAPFGILTDIFSRWNAVIANSHPDDVQGPEDIPNLLAEFVLGLPFAVLEEFVDILAALLGNYTGDDPSIIQIQNIFAPVRTLMLLFAGQDPNSGLVPTVEEVVAGAGQYIGALAGLELAVPGIVLAKLNELESSAAGIIDTLYNNLIGTNATDVPLGLLAAAIRQVQQDIETATNATTTLFTTVQTFGGALQQFVESADDLPIYQGWQDFLEQIGLTLGTVWGNVVTSLSPGNPAVSANTGQIEAIWAHLNSGTSGIKYDFGPAALTANYPNTTNPSWTDPTGGSAFLTVHTGTDYVDSGVDRAGVFTGNPSGAALDHGLITDKVHVGATVKHISNYGGAAVFCCGNGTAAVGQHVELFLNHQAFGDSLTIYTLTGLNAGAVQRRTVSIPAIKVNDTIAVEYDNAGNFAMFHNGMEVGTPWDDTGLVVTHGAGHRECGMYTFSNGFGAPSIGLGAFVAYDY